MVDSVEKVICLDLGFILGASLAILAGAYSVSVPLIAELHSDLELAKELMDGAKLFVPNTPTNPTGAVESRESIKDIGEYAADAGVTVVSDEVYEHFIYGKKHLSAGQFGDNVITTNATSKKYAMTGWRLGYLAASSEIVSLCIKLHHCGQACATSVSE